MSANPLKPGQLAGKTAFVTGSSRGIGADTVGFLAEAGARVAINYRDKEARAEKVAAGIRDAGGEAGAADTRAAGVAGLAEREGLVDFAVAVIVDAVADLLDRLGRRATEETAAFTSLGASGAGAEEAGVTSESDRGIGLIDGTVAVIVLAVASLVVGQGAAPAADLALHAGGAAESAGALLAGHRAGKAAAGVLLVDGAIAVIVAQIAGVGRGAKVGLADEDATLAAVDAGRTQAELAGVADAVEPGVALIGEAIAVIVDAVAGLFDDRSVRAADEPAGGA